MEALSSEASYWAVLFIRPSIRASRDPDSAPFRAMARSWADRHRFRSLRDMNHSDRQTRVWWSPEEGENLLGLPLILEGDLSALLVAASGQDVRDGLLVHTCRTKQLINHFDSSVTKLHQRHGDLTPGSFREDPDRKSDVQTSTEEDHLC